ncbi:hypothetical protein PYH37_004661 [Sinorhizobium numidicum]|uniref:Uncharacterized protein n=1 Tax=Sinorhizobium numidicum TaxID=680248 RepID=A0ABY8CYS1_9HYPH|nr:hypothetical protein [Sinorhizobium numidicum]WEX76361.1 hypothetical protein PYH37_004661 [Sinorhizobium numidicum]WEX83022.1 hypothetical protein PYH38_005373 [Sinorhizobium numidicum]
MSFEHWFAFAAASAVPRAIPAPTILLVISYALGGGRRTAGATVAGVALGDFTVMTASRPPARQLSRDLHRFEIGCLPRSAAGSTIRKPNIRRIVNRTGGSPLNGAGLLTDGLKRATS